ncbi:MAG: 50S ribosomal protein L25/general stress protein Ctc [Alphaproteobacteria bacterium]|nr:50S ribosomal protein L25/general stress protein Ctc [Alphaproteobacteria bacterium]MDE2013716.1 50S ribosomal protein L25/general stress protein Ctc [Alphaproteobacteria bacterium]MDE2074716.1 50S ribosomal protein L25/general stress protein Ctc [Alphaproteobacteria bacterium]
MRETQELKAEKRAATGKGPAYQTRQKGFTPGIIYGGKNATPEPVMVVSRDLERHATTGTFLTTPFVLNLDGQKTRVIPRDVQLHPVTDRPVHVDFMRLEKGSTIILDIPVRFKGHAESPGLKRGGTLNIVRHEIKLVCPADSIPEYLEGDLSGLEINDSLHISSIALPEGVVATIKRDFTIASVVAPSGMADERAAAAAAEAAPAEGAAAPAAEKK